MQKFRYSSADIYVHEKTVQFCGKTIKKSKKKVKWKIMHRTMLHEIECIISFMSGKKKVVHNGMTVIDLVSSDEILSAILKIGVHRVIIKVEKQIEHLKIERSPQDSAHKNAFHAFKNVLSGELKDVYSLHFNT